MNAEDRGSVARKSRPILNVPSGVLWVVAGLAAIHAGFSLLDEDQRNMWRVVFAVIPARYVDASLDDDLPLSSGAGVWTLVTHQFLHGDWDHLALNAAWFLICGGAVARRCGFWKAMALALVSGIAGALLFVAGRWGEPMPMIGASGAISGLMGGMVRYVFSAVGFGGWLAIRNYPDRLPRMSLRRCLSDRYVRLLTAYWVATNVGTVLAAPLLTSAGGIAWEAHLGGFATGLAAFGLFDRPERRMEPPAASPSGRTLH